MYDWNQIADYEYEQAMEELYDWEENLPSAFDGDEWPEDLWED